jgi:hypothetical protein
VESGHELVRWIVRPVPQQEPRSLPQSSPVAMIGWRAPVLSGIDQAASVWWPCYLTGAEEGPVFADEG